MLSWTSIEHLKLEFELDWTYIDRFLIQVGFKLIINLTNLSKLQPSKTFLEKILSLEAL